MDVLLRAIAIIVEVMILLSIVYVLLTGARLTIFDLGLSSAYNRVVRLLLIMLGSMVLVFLIAHLTAFYPAI